MYIYSTSQKSLHTTRAYPQRARPSDAQIPNAWPRVRASLLTRAYARVTAYYFHAAIFEALCVQKNTGVEVIII